jgi:hypothetical protein
VKVADCHYDLGCVKFDNVFREPLLALEDLVEFTTSHERHDKVESELRLEQIVHADKEWVIAAEQDIFLKLSIVNLVILEKNILSD